MEAQMVALWTRVLARPVGPDDDLFADLAADSLEVLELLECIGDEFGVIVSVEDLFQAPTAVGAAGLVQARGVPTPS
ncbi:MAG: acyl carrier protein [Jatrophihabitans sp.]